MWWIEPVIRGLEWGMITVVCIACVMCLTCAWFEWRDRTEE